MLRNKTKKDYLAPRSVVAEVDLEGLICQSLRFNVQTKDLENMNDSESEHFDASEIFYFES